MCWRVIQRTTVYSIEAFNSRAKTTVWLASDRESVPAIVHVYANPPNTTAFANTSID